MPYYKEKKLSIPGLPVPAGLPTDEQLDEVSDIHII